MAQAYDGATAQSLDWRKSSYSNPSGECVEVAPVAEREIAVRNSRTPAEGTLTFTHGEMLAFIRGVKDGEFDYLIA